MGLSLGLYSRARIVFEPNKDPETRIVGLEHNGPESIRFDVGRSRPVGLIGQFESNISDLGWVVTNQAQFVEGP